MSNLQLMVVFDLLLLAMGGLMAAQNRMIPALSIFGAFGFVAVWQVLLASVSDSVNRTYRWELFFKPTHYIQAACHISMFTYLGLYWEGVGRYAPLILTQIIFGYLFDMLLSWSRGHVWRIGFGVLPIVFSINLLLQFREPVFYLQFGLVALAFLGKEFVTWNYDGRRRHIVNPSALALSVASVLLVATGTDNWTHAVDITAAFDSPPNFYEVVFLLGLVVQALFIVTPVSFGAAGALYLIFLLTPYVFGSALTPSPFQTSVLLGITFLVTDPATSPRSHFGRFLFGIGYGTGVYVVTVVLQYFEEPSVFAKLLVVPVFNLLVPTIDRFCDRLSLVSRPLFQPIPHKPTPFSRYSWLAAYIALIVTMLPALKTPNDKPIPFLPRPQFFPSDDVKRILNAMIWCRYEFPEAYKPFGFQEEFANLSRIREIYRDGPTRMPPPPPGFRPQKASQ